MISDHQDKYLDALERLAGAKLPDSYRRFLLGDLPGPQLPISVAFVGADGCSTATTVIKFTLLRDGERSPLEDAYSFYVVTGRVANAVLPIAKDIAGNLLCIGLTGDKAGRIYFWDHELEVAYDCDKNLALVAKSFDQLA